ncbi:MAG: creatininase family protein [Caulobacterales bacterium]|nr:creatininase family protein [Caulobacterales bacterium]
MTVAEVRALRERTDLVIIPLGALEQHGDHLPIGADFLNGVERCKLIAQERDMLVAPVLMGGQSPYHMGFPGTISLRAETILQVHMEAVESLIQHGFRRFILVNAHGGNRAITTLLADQINQRTAGVAVTLSDAIRPYIEPIPTPPSPVLDRHAGAGETSNSLFLIPTLVDLSDTRAVSLTLPSHLEAMLADVVAEEPTAKLVFLAEGLKAEETGKRTSAAEMTETGVWGERDPAEGTAARGALHTRQIVDATVAFVDRWNELESARR